MPIRNQTTKSAIELTRYEQRRQEMVDYLGGICAGCGTSSRLQIHHKDPSTKEYAISRMWSYNWELIRKELDKCELRCDPCHKRLK